MTDQEHRLLLETATPIMAALIGQGNYTRTEYPNPNDRSVWYPKIDYNLAAEHATKAALALIIEVSSEHDPT